MVQNYYILIVVISTIIFIQGLLHKRKRFAICITISLLGYVSAYMFYVSGQILTCKYNKTITVYKEELSKDTKNIIFSKTDLSNIVLLNKMGYEIAAIKDKNTHYVNDNKNYAIIEKRTAECPKYIIKKLWDKEIKPINIYKEIHY